MKNHIFPAIRLTVVCILFFVVAYSVIVWGFAKIAGPNHGNAETVQSHGKTVAVKLIGQTAGNDSYFQGRPSAVSYNGGGSGGSNKGPSNPDYLKDVQSRIDSFLVHNPTIKKADIPAELVTASGSGLDPHISPYAANVQIARISKIRNLREGKLQKLIESKTTQPFLGLFGTSYVNVTELNLALNDLSVSQQLTSNTTPGHQKTTY